MIGPNPMSYNPLGYTPTIAPVYSCKPEFENNQFFASEDEDETDKEKPGTKIEQKKENCWNLVNTIINKITSSKHYSIILSEYEAGNDEITGPFGVMTEDIEFLNDEINSPCETTRFGDVKDILIEIIKNWVQSLEACGIDMDETNAIATDLREILDSADENFAIPDDIKDIDNVAVEEWLEENYDVTIEEFEEDIKAIAGMINDLRDVTGMNDDETLQSKIAKHKDRVYEYETVFTGYGDIDNIASLAPLFGAFADIIDQIEQRTLDDEYSSINPEIVDDSRKDFNEIIDKYMTNKRECETADLSWSILKSECKCKSKVALYKKPTGKIKIGIGAVVGILVLLFGGIGIAKLVSKRKHKQVI